MKPSILVMHDGEPVALVNAQHLTLVGAGRRLGSEDPRLRQVLRMAAYAQRIAQEKLPGPYSNADASVSR
jgi:hypothetical protein